MQALQALARPYFNALGAALTADTEFALEDPPATLPRRCSATRTSTHGLLHEATQALQTTPIASFVDAGAREPGEHFPYELHANLLLGD